MIAAFSTLVAASADWSRPKCGTPNTGQDIISEWGAKVSPENLPDFGYPRPQMTRDESTTFTNLNGLWEFQPSTGTDSPPFGQKLNQSILVPFPVEACLSGIGKNYKNLWYRTSFDAPKNAFNGGSTLLHFGAVDWQSSVYLNGQELGNHTGGYDGFDFDITPHLKPTGNELIVYVYDPSDGGPQPQGKQRIGSITSPGGDHYTPTTGIWQTVWLETVPTEHITHLRIGADTTALTLAVYSTTAAQKFTVSIKDGDKVVASSSGTTEAGSDGGYFSAGAAVGGAVSVSIPSPQLWSPDSPFLYNMTVTLDGGDSVDSYFGMRSFALGQEAGSADGVTRPLLNGKFTFAAGWLDQSWWPDGQYTAPGDAALASDQKAVKMFGMNMVRLHQKVNPERWYYWADKLGIMIFQDAVQHFGNNPSKDLFKSDHTQMIFGRGNHPSIVQWDIFNEGDCIRAFGNDFAQEMVNYTRTLQNPTGFKPYTRLVDTNSGGPANNLAIGDVNDIHDYPYPKDPKPSAMQYAMVGEFGGIGAFIQGKEWVPGKCHTYLKVNTATDEANKYVEMVGDLKKVKGDVSASVYTQITDVELECDGFLNYDRSNKFSDAETAAIFKANQDLISS